MRLARSSKFLLHIELITNSSVDEDPVPVKKSNILNRQLYLYFAIPPPSLCYSLCSLTCGICPSPVTILIPVLMVALSVTLIVILFCAVIVHRLWLIVHNYVVHGGSGGGGGFQRVP